MPGPKPKLEKLATPVTSNFPSAVTSAITSANTGTPLSAFPPLFKADPDFIKTPISPPLAYTDFLSKAMSLNSSAVVSGELAPESPRDSDSPVATDSSEKADSPKDEQPSPATSTSSSKPSPPTSATASASEKAAALERALASASASLVPPSPYAKVPMSAPLMGPTSFPSFKLPPSPAVSNLESPMSAVGALRSPYSGRSVRSVFDWDAALKAHYAEQKRSKTSRTSVRHIREVVTRTVTYTPRMEPAPRGKRRKLD
ncbi:hypothetical protein NQ176_g10548 [Zarea fungicola]|uniref:Uncharacterized protein n=1 Tax=Zarea fungicola TaxID=93591 RepID=A0ACC1MGB9_9HYPO|nr:hypothetical protein NQ176_g10548 [Lecanicillium fungicola]